MPIVSYLVYGSHLGAVWLVTPVGNLLSYPKLYLVKAG